MTKRYRIPSEMHLLVSRRVDRVLNPPIGYYVTNLNHFKAGLRFLLLPLLIETLSHFKIALSQLVPNTIRVIMRFERFYRDRQVITSLSFFQSLFILNMSPVKGGTRLPPDQSII